MVEVHKLPTGLELGGAQDHTGLSIRKLGILVSLLAAGMLLLIQSAQGRNAPQPPTLRSSVCQIFGPYVQISCNATGLYTYSFSYFFGECPFGVYFYGDVFLEVSETSGGPWMVYDQQAINVQLPTGGGNIEGSFNESPIPPPYVWYHMHLVANTDSGGPRDDHSESAAICNPGVLTATPTATATTEPPSFTPTPTSCPTAWELFTSPDVGTLRAVDALSASDVWAVGDSILHWDGSQWTSYESPIGPLNGVSAMAANDVWAVGNGTIHWDGAIWNTVPSPNLGTLKGVAAVSSNEAWAVGYTSGTPSQTLILHWFGGQWTQVASPNPGASNNSLQGVAVVSANDVWAVGYSNTGMLDGQTLILHWNSSSWLQVSSPNPGTTGNRLYGVSAAANEVWAVGEWCSDAACHGRTLALLWNGSSWAQQTTPNFTVEINRLLGVDALTNNDAWAVGAYFGFSASWESLILHWNGVEWSRPSHPALGSGVDMLYGVAASAANDAWAVGFYNSNQTLVERYTPVCPTSTPIPPTNTVTQTPSPPTSTATATPTPIPPTNTATVTSTSTTPTPILPTTTVTQTAGPPTNTSTATTATATSTQMPVISSPTRSPSGTATSTPTATYTSCSIQFTDVPNGSTFYAYVRCLACRGIINGYPDNTFRPNNNVTRGQLSKIVSNAAGFNDLQTTQIFQDVAVGSTFFDFIGRLASRGHIGGYPCGGTGEPCGVGNLPYFRPNNNATRGQTAKIVANTFYPGCQTPHR